VWRGTWTLDSSIPIVDASTMDTRLVESVARPTFLLRLAATFAAIAVLLASVGVYGTASYWSARRKRELGIRVALGASDRSVRALVIGRSVRLAVWGWAAGLVLSLGITKLLASLLFQTSARDPVIFLGMPGLLGGLVLVACYLPARQASRVDPLVALRYE
jgi:putative ABC transport system permease protein